MNKNTKKVTQVKPVQPTQQLKDLMKGLDDVEAKFNKLFKG